MSVIWSGRIRIEEPSISAAQFETFFEHGEHNISFETANTILANRTKGFLDEVVPADELKLDFIRLIHKQIAYGGLTSGQVEADGEILHWAWNPNLAKDGTQIDITKLSMRVLEQILSDMLEKNCRWGII